jgi:hypothetical protein
MNGREESSSSAMESFVKNLQCESSIDFDLSCCWFFLHFILRIAAHFARSN